MKKGTKCVMLTEELKNEVCKLYNEGERLDDIAIEVGMPLTTLKRRITAWKKDGTLPPGIRSNRKIKKYEHHKPLSEYKQREYSGFPRCKEARFIPGKTPIPTNETPVRGTKGICKTCRFGVGECLAYKCDFITITGQMRGCPAKACTHYEKITKEKPRYVSQFSMRGSSEDIFARKESK